MTQRYRINWDVFNKVFPLTLDSEPESEISQDRPRKRRRGPQEQKGLLESTRNVGSAGQYEPHKTAQGS